MCTLEPCCVPGFAEGRNERLGSPEPSPPLASLRDQLICGSKGFLTRWGATHPPWTFQHNPGIRCNSSSNAPGWCGTGESFPGPTAALVGGRGRDHPGLVISGSEGPQKRHLPPQVRRPRTELPPRGLHVLGVTLLPPQDTLTASGVGEAPRPQEHRDCGSQEGRPWGGNASKESTNLPDLPLGATSCGHLTVTVSC